MSARRFIPQAIPQAALLDHELPNSGLGYKVLEAVAYYSSLGTCRASNATLAGRAGCSPRTVRRWLTLWIEKGRVCDLTSRGRGRRSRSRQLLVVGMPPAATAASAPKRKRRRRRPAPSKRREVATADHRTLTGAFPSEKPSVRAHAQSAASAGGAPAPAVRPAITDDERQQHDLAAWRERGKDRSQAERERVTGGFADLLKGLAQAGRASARAAFGARSEVGRASRGCQPDGRSPPSHGVPAASGDEPRFYLPSTPEAQAYIDQVERTGEPEEAIARYRRHGVKLRPSEARRILAGGEAGPRPVASMFAAVLAMATGTPGPKEGAP